jgi:hypothetical protein
LPPDIVSRFAWTSEQTAFALLSQPRSETNSCAGPLAHLDEAAHEWFASDEFDRLLLATVRSTFPSHEHEKFAEHYRGLLAGWCDS